MAIRNRASGPVEDASVSPSGGPPPVSGHASIDGQGKNAAGDLVRRIAVWSVVASAWAIATVAVLAAGPTRAVAAGGTLTIHAESESTREPVVTRLELRRDSPDGRLLNPRRSVAAGVGVVLDRSLDLTLADGDYFFRAVRGPEYRIVSGRFTLQRDSLDEHTVPLPRMVEMRSEGWTSGDCLVPPSRGNLPLRMAAEDLHVASTAGVADDAPTPGRGPEEPIRHEPIWVVENAEPLGGLVFYRTPTVAGEDVSGRRDAMPVEVQASIDPDSPDTRVAVENPFAWPLPVWLASRRIEGFFVLGDWLRLDRDVLRVGDGREPPGLRHRDGRALGFMAEEIYWKLLDAGFRIPPLAGSGSDGSTTPVGYNRLYVAAPDAKPAVGNSEFDSSETSPTRVTDADAWWRGAWRGRSVATNGPLLRPRLGGRLPGHRFVGRDGERLELQVELSLSVRDPVRYLEVIHNGRVHYSARLDEFAAAGGVIPKLVAEESGWVLVRVVTEFPDHFRAAISAPWYLEFDGRPRVTPEAVAFFQTWLRDYEQRLAGRSPEEIARHAPYIRAARAFWADR